MKRSIRLLGLLAAALAACGDDGGSNTPACGDGEITAGEQCDDNNTTSGDGCSSTCQLEGGPDCGNGVLDGSEECDDDNTASGDGCSPTCTVDSGYTCTGEPSVCTPIVNADGTCAAPYVVAFTNAAGVLTGSGTGTTAASTDQVGDADCDFGDAGGGAKDHIWQFTITQPSDVSIGIRATTTFDTILRVLAQPCALDSEVAEYTGVNGCSDEDESDPTEYLDYAALPAGTYYIVIDGYGDGDEGTYEFDITAAPTLCGNGMIDDLEFCDDNDTMDGDGCNARCEPEEGYTCDDSEPSVCTTSCGDGTWDLFEEECDDGNNVSGDRCSATCTLEFDVAEVEPNDTTPQVLTAGSHVIRGSLTAGDVDLYTFTLTQPATVSIETYETIDASLAYDGRGNDTRFDCEDGFLDSLDTLAYLFDSSGDPTDDQTALYADDDDGAGWCSYLGPNDGPDDGVTDPTQGVLQPGTYTIRIEHLDPDAEAPIYMLDLKITTVPAASTLVINEYMAADNMSDTNCDGSTSGTVDEFIELVNVGTTAIDLAGVTIDDGANDALFRHVFPASTPPLQPGKAIVVWGGGAPACPGVTDFQVASEGGGLGLNDNGDTITVATGGPNPVTLATVTYASATPNVSANLSPDVTGTTYVLHNTISATAYSPGKRADGTAF